MEVKGEQIRKELTDMGFKTIVLWDNNYFCPSEDWLKGEFSPYLWHHKPVMNEVKYNCKNISRWAVVQADDCFRISKVVPDGVGAHSFGQVGLRVGFGMDLNGIYADGFTTCHSTNIVRLNSGIWMFYESQNQTYRPALEACNDGSIGELLYAIL